MLDEVCVQSELIRTERIVQRKIEEEWNKICWKYKIISVNEYEKIKGKVIKEMS